jgi:trk system potassium uptake protein TrkA
MHIIVIGAGEVGRHLCQQLSHEDHDVVLIDRDQDKLRRVERDLNILTITGNGGSNSVLREAGVSKADLFIAVTDIDEVNLIACIMAKQSGARSLIARVRSEDYLNADSPFNGEDLGIDLLINPDKVMAEEILRISAFTHSFEIVEFARGEVMLIGYQVDRANPVSGIALADLKSKKGKHEFVIVAIVRQGETLIPRGDDIIMTGDKIYIVVRKNDVRAAEATLGLEQKPLEKVFIIGGGRVGLNVAKELEQQAIDVYVVEKNSNKCEYLAEELENAVVLNVDGLEARDLIQEGIDAADLLVAVTNGDTTNILASLLAKHHGARKCITRISHPDFIPLLGKLGIDVALSSRLVAANMILRFVRRGLILSVASLLGSDAEVVEFIVSDRWKYAETALKEIKFPRQANIGAVIRNGEVIIPSGDTIFHNGDRLIIFTMKTAVPRVEKLLTA